MMGTRQKCKDSWETDLTTAWRKSVRIDTAYIKRKMRRRRRHEAKQEVSCVASD